MFGKDFISAVIVSFYILTYCIFLLLPGMLAYAMMMLVLSPLLILWMIYTILKHGKYNGRELEDEEFGYQDKNKDDLHTF